jgi:hypothetical protein
MWCRRRTENTSWTNRVRNEEVLHRVQKQIDILLAIKRRKANWIGHILRRNWLRNHVIEAKISVKRKGEKKGISSCWMALRKREKTVN